MLESTKGSLTIIDPNTPDVKVFWNGALVPFVISLRIDWEGDEQRVKLQVSKITPLLEAELVASGITVKKGVHHV